MPFRALLLASVGLALLGAPASAQVLTHFYGTDAITFTARSDALPNVVRTYHSLSSCADEVGMSRVYGGIHFSFSNREGKLCGGKIGDYIYEHCLLPLESSLKNPEAEKRGPESPNGN